MPTNKNSKICKPSVKINDIVLQEISYKLTPCFFFLDKLTFSLSIAASKANQKKREYINARNYTE